MSKIIKIAADSVIVSGTARRESGSFDSGHSKESHELVRRDDEFIVAPFTMT
jgi:hypothetical protein